MRVRTRRVLRACALYVLLVAPPLAGLLAILHVGEQLEAPRAIGGTWRAEVGVVPAACGRVAETEPIWRIAQSGRRAQLRFGDPVVATAGAALDGDRLVGAGVAPDTTCAAFTLDARLGPRGDELVATLRYPTCPACRPVVVHAVRRAAKRREGE